MGSLRAEQLWYNDSLGLGSGLLFSSANQEHLTWPGSHTSKAKDTNDPSYWAINLQGLIQPHSNWSPMR